MFLFKIRRVKHAGRNVAERCTRSCMTLRRGAGWRRGTVTDHAAPPPSPRSAACRYCTRLPDDALAVLVNFRPTRIRRSNIIGKSFAFRLRYPTPFGRRQQSYREIRLVSTALSVRGRVFCSRVDIFTIVRRPLRAARSPMIFAWNGN